ncbi:MAG: LytTR family transcriptional regulator DNA-binding domain-containing protein [Aminipila sp.]
MKDKEIIIKFKGEVRKIDSKEIIVIEQNLRKVFFHLGEEVCVTYGKISEYEPILPKEFYRCNKSYIMNLDKIIKMEKQIIYFSDNTDIRLGRKSFCAAKKAFLAFVLQTECKIND